MFPLHATQMPVKKIKIRMMLEGQNVEVKHQNFP
jgi:hypothetical protein